MKRLLLLGLGALVAGCTHSPTAPVTISAPRIPAANNEVTIRTVRLVWDGDSLVVAAADGSESEVRLLGINAPEHDECHGDLATIALEEMLTEQGVVLVADGADRDQYGRLLRQVYVDGTNVNLALVAAGHAVAVQTGHSMQAEFLEREDEAIDAALGMWAPDACGAAAGGDIVIADFVADPPGADGANRNAEWVALANHGEEPVDLGGWILRDESTANRYQFATTAEIAPGATVRVHSGCGNDTEDDLYWCSENPVWSNGGDTIIVQDPAGTVTALTRYPS